MELRHEMKISAVLCFWCFLIMQGLSWAEETQVYVVYMGAAPADSSVDMLTESHLQLLASVSIRGKKLIRSYRHGFSGFSARLSKEQAVAIAQKPGVLSVFEDPIYQLHTTRSWDFLQQTSVEIDSNLDEDDAPSPRPISDTIIGLLDTGIWPESPSFSDQGMGSVPKRWKGICMEGTNFSAANCNKKLIGARCYSSDEDIAAVFPGELSPRDTNGHGTHTASTAAGNSVAGASYYGLAAGTAKGGSTSSRIAVYKVCFWDGCPGSAILAGFDDAIADGVDLLSVSIGAPAIYMPDFDKDPIAIGAFHAVAKGITVVCSAGNDGPTSSTVTNAAPWILTVAATTIDRHFESDIVQGNNKSIEGEGINFSNLTKSPVYPLIYGEAARSNSSSGEGYASHCDYETLDSKKIKGKIVLCINNKNDDSSETLKIDGLQSSGAVGAIFIDDLERAVANIYTSFPVTKISSRSADEILSYINSTKNPVASILPTITVNKYRPAPAVAYFSSRGPSSQTSNILKPDVAAPGVNILASWIQEVDSSDNVPPGQKLSGFNLVSGTSMACPHVTGVAATIKAWNQKWSPAAIRSAIMTTATQLNNDKAPVTTDAGLTATPYDIGAGEVSPTAALQPGLVYDIEPDDYLFFLCNYGYSPSKISLITTIRQGFECPANSSKDLISNLNYPSIAISNLSGKGSKIVSRIVTNIGAEDVTYNATVNSPPQLNVKVVPDKLHFTKYVKKLSYQVIFSATNSYAKADLFGSITWSDGVHRVRSSFAVRST
ncbi:CO(2)-response secreted protease-like [Zingiber officinale]|uniref:CO(2)-response secreted protease-like n=1 Tax=Zingiber officinale TaxID=94328 RepID=UPI001C4BA88E|nr:CO(2)-response secreted protease-like [Zingiber officinale]